MKKKRKSKKSISLESVFLSYPEWKIPSTTHESMLNMGYKEAFRVKASHEFVKDEIWYTR